jgi:hypothetical protein
MRESELHIRAPGQWIQNPSSHIRFQIVSYQNPKFEDSKLKNGGKKAYFKENGLS